jgi:hypothetical protein
MISLHNSYETLIESTYIITLPKNPISVQLTDRCITSLNQIQQPYTLWEGFDGTQATLEIPDHLKNKAHILFPKLVFTELSNRQIGCFMSHYSLWCHCLEIDKPITILEHDAVMIKPYVKHALYNSIIYLGSWEQYNGTPIYATPPHASDYNGHLRSLCRSHAYSIDPAVARHLVSYVIRNGLINSLDMMIRADLFPIAMFDLYAFDAPAPSTIARN